MSYETREPGANNLAEKKGVQFDLILRTNQQGNYELFFDGLQDKGRDVVIEIEGVSEEQAKKLFDHVGEMPEGTNIATMLTSAKRYKEELLRPE